MNKKNNFKKAAALLLGIALAAGSTGCNFVVTNNEKDLAQTVAEIDISGSLKKDPNSEYQAVADEVAAIVKNLSTDISKRDLVAYFLSVGYQYVESYGYTYEATFNMLMDGLVSREIMIQYAIAYYLKNYDNITVKGCNDYIDAQLTKVSEDEKALLKAHPEVLTLKYFLTEGKEGEEAEEDYNRAVYSLKKSLNDSLDSLENSYIKAQSEEHDHAEARTLPTGVDTEKADYSTKNYDVYTGRNTPDSCGEYERLDGSTPSTRQNAYNSFLANLQSYNMISTSGKIEDTSKVTNLNYYYVELASSLGQSLINKYYEDLADAATASINEEYATAKYNEILAAQQEKYEGAPSTFATAMDGVSDTSFLLYGLKDFGYVYNILIPFSTSQNVQYTAAKNNTANSQDDLYNIRKSILNNVKGKDLRDTWISDHDHANYSFKGEDGKYYFFEEGLTGTEKYEKLKQYAGTYAFDGTVEEVDGELEVTANAIDIDTFIGVMEAQINKTVGSNVASGSVDASYAKNEKNTVYTDEATGKVDYSKFVYYTGKADLGTVAAKDYFDENSNVYKAVSAVNELMFAYSTDPGCLNTYYGYSVSPYTTNFVKEFEYAAQKAVKDGVGTYVVCATDYGWHIIFATYVFEGGEVYGGYDHKAAVGYFNENNKWIEPVEGSFSNLFYESLKSTVANTTSTEVQNNVLNRYNNDDSVTLYKDRYQDLLDLE